MKHNIEIDGATRLYLIIGDPIVQAKSPSVYSQLFADRGIPAVMLPLHIHPQGMKQLGPLLESIQNLDGILVTARTVKKYKSLKAPVLCYPKAL